MKTRAMLLSAAAATLMALPALAQDAGAPPPMQNDGASGAAPMRMPMRGGGMMGGMGMMDANHDGAVSKDEWMAQFDKLDANHDGKITADEMRSARQMRMGRMNATGQQMQGQGGPGGAMTGGPPQGAPDQAPAAGADQPPPQDDSGQ
jgi:hypothetical protein